MEKIKGDVYFNRLIDHALSGKEDIDGHEHSWENTAAIKALKGILSACQSEQEYVDVLTYVIDYVKDKKVKHRDYPTDNLQNAFHKVMMDTIKTLEIPLRSYDSLFTYLCTKLDFEKAYAANHNAVPVQYYDALAKYNRSFFISKLGTYTNTLVLKAVLNTEDTQFIIEHSARIKERVGTAGRFTIATADVAVLKSPEDLLLQVAVYEWLVENLPYKTIYRHSYDWDLLPLTINHSDTARIKYLSTFLLTEFDSLIDQTDVHLMYLNSRLPDAFHLLGLPSIPISGINQKYNLVTQGKLFTTAIRVAVNNKERILYSDNARVYTLLALVLKGLQKFNVHKPTKPFMHAARHVANQWIGEVCLNVIL